MMFLLLLICSILFTTCEKDIDDNSTTTSQSVNYQLGFIATPSSEYANIPNASAPAPSGTLPSSFFLEIPATPFDQGQLGSCVSCASSMAKSVLDYVKYNTSFPNNGITYSPSFLYNQSKVDPNNCQAGSYVYTNLEVLKNQGICKLSDMAYDKFNCSTPPTNAQKNLAASHKIDHYFKIDPISISWIKEYIHAGLPVIIAFQVDDYFMTATANSIWKSFGLVSKGNHCTMLYGWDDGKNAFKMLNSWGSKWGNNGTIWVDYNFIQNGSSLFYGKIFYEAYIIQNPAVINNMPTANFDVNGGSTTINSSQQISFRDKSLNNPTSWSWSFPGGTPSSSTLKSPSITYSTPGNYNVSLTVSNQSGSDTKTLTNYILVNRTVQKPVAQFAASGNTTITSGSSVSFVDQSSNNPTSWSWSFPGGNPSSSTAQNPIITYSTAGNYDVTLTVNNQSGNNAKTLTNYIQVNQVVQTPVAQFAANGNTTITAGSSVSFVDQSSNNPTSWSWSFPGGTPSSSTAQNPAVTYSTSGNYNVNLTAFNQAGSDSKIKSGYITVNSDQTSNCGQPFTDPRDGNTYATVSIGSQCWMAEDSRYVTPKSLLWNGKRYYEYVDAINIAPSGWHLPSDAEWQTLEIFLGMNPTQANTDGWRGTDQGYKVRDGGSSGLNLNLNGAAYRDYNNEIVFSGYNGGGCYWTSTKYFNSSPSVNKYVTIGRLVNISVPSQIYRFNGDVTNNFYSVRFIKD